ncbi:MAG TPA: sulfotransferase [Prolixibacteraceae bacterium]|nr:sulfotransferase [Prolixibacteraceae bacterium]
MDEFKIPPISTLAGSTLTNYFKILRLGHIAPRYYIKILLTTLIVLIATPFHLWEKMVFRRRIREFKFQKQPLFILGHWRSGTTLLHNMLTKDPSAGYVTTYHSLFPNNLASKWLFRTFMRINMPDKRPSDGVELNIDFPQEDEFAFSNCQPNAYYNFFYFPTGYKTFYEKSVNHKGLTSKETELWFTSYDQLLKKALIDTKGNRIIIKNPVNTARIAQILKLYPDAKFLYIYRNPITVFHSTRRFFQQLYPTLWFHKVDNQFIDNMIFDIYTHLMNSYLEQKSQIPPENLMELRFEEFEQNPVREMEKIYAILLKEDFRKVSSCFSDYFKTQKGHKKNKYSVDAAEIEAVRTHWGKFIEMYNYDIPPDVTVRTGEIKPKDDEPDKMMP